LQMIRREGCCPRKREGCCARKSQCMARTTSVRLPRTHIRTRTRYSRASAAVLFVFGLCGIDLGLSISCSRLDIAEIVDRLVLIGKFADGPCNWRSEFEFDRPVLNLGSVLIEAYTYVQPHCHQRQQSLRMRVQQTAAAQSDCPRSITVHT